MSVIFDVVVTAGMMSVIPIEPLIDENNYKQTQRIQHASPIDLDCSFVEIHTAERVITDYKCVKPKQPVDEHNKRE